jgi:ABC-type antimicrobial peptide transport system permease subunit
MRSIYKTIKHSFLMVSRELHTYTLLSVSIVLSFSFLLGFFVYFDSHIYNKYKEVLSLPSTIIHVSPSALYNQNPVDHIKFQLLSDRLDRMNETNYFSYFVSDEELNHYSDDENKVIVHQYFIPGDAAGSYLYSGGFKQINVIEGSDTLVNPFEVLIDERLFSMLPLQQTGGIPTVVLPVTINGVTVLKEFTVVGIVSGRKESISTSSGVATHYCDVYMSRDLIIDYSCNYSEMGICIVSPYIVQITQLVRSLGLEVITTDYFQRQAVDQIRNQIILKGSIVIIMFTLLGLNLYSSFSNVLKERRYEIGVKRAVGASKKDIITQFFFEGIVVMGANICITLLLVLNLAVIYKLIQRVFYNSQWIININPHSITLFAFCAITLSLSSGFVFAFQSTQVEIIKYIKAE